MKGVKEYEKEQAKEQTKEQANEGVRKRAKSQANSRERGRKRDGGGGEHLLLSPYFFQSLCHFTRCLSLAYFLYKDCPFIHLQNQLIYLTYIHLIVNKWLLPNDI